MPVLDDRHSSVADREIATALLDAMSDAAAVVGPDGVIVAVNHAWRMFCLDNGGDPERSGVAVNYLDVCERAAATGCADAQIALAGLKAVLAGETVERTFDYACSSPTVVRWFMLRITPVAHPELGALVSHTNITRRKIVEQSVTDGSLDPVTRLPDREQLAGWLQRGRTAPPEAAAAGEVGMLYIHVDGIDWIADAFGEAARDEVLQAVAQRLAAVTRRGDGIARLGENEFAVAAPGITATGLTGLQARVRHALTETLTVRGRAVELGATVGTYLAALGEDLTNCLRLADESSYSIRRARHPGDRPAPPSRRAMTDVVRTAEPIVGPGPASAFGRPDAPADLPQQASGGTVPPTKARRAPDLSDRALHREDGIGEHPRLHELSVALELTLAERTTELQLRTGELAAAKKELEDFAYSVSHDLRAPLRAMSGFARILVEDHTSELAAEAQHYLERIQASAGEMGQQIDGLLMLSRLQRRRLSHVDLDMTATVRDAWEQVKPADRPVHFHVADLPGARGDQELVDQLIGHLLYNAAKFTARVSEPRIEVSADVADGSVVYVVADNGVGFDRRCANRLFSPFQRLHPSHEYPGIGIGLAAAQQIVRVHGGTIDAQAAPEQGARFRFTLGPATTCS
jgi:diguanylate cyclase (GGDEF)-like protein